MMKLQYINQAELINIIERVLAVSYSNYWVHYDEGPTEADIAITHGDKITEIEVRIQNNHISGLREEDIAEIKECFDGDMTVDKRAENVYLFNL